MAKPVINIVLVGRTGNGKSATGNTILGERLFVSKRQEEGVTMECEMFRATTQDGPIINVIDTPGLFDLSVSLDYINNEIIKCVSMAKEGIHAVLFLLSVNNRISEEEESALYSLQRIFDGKIVDYIIVVFTGGDKLVQHGLILEDYLRGGCPKFLTRILRLCGGRKILFDNWTRDKDKKAAQLKQLMSHVADVGKQTGGKPYTPNWRDFFTDPVKNIAIVRHNDNEKSATGNTLLGQKLFSSRGQAVPYTMKWEKCRATIQDGPIINVIDTPEPAINIVLVGRTGNGKSATGNTLVGLNVFMSRRQAAINTMHCQSFRAATKDGPIINVIDTPGLFDLSVSADYISKEIINCLIMPYEGIHAVLFVLSVKNRITHEEESTLNSLQCILGSKILDYLIVVFTCGDYLEDDGLTLDDYLSQGCPEFLTSALRLCGGRMVLFDNKTYDKDKKTAQLRQLLAQVEDVGRQTGGKPYTYSMHRTIKEENDKIREGKKEIESKNLAETEATEMMERWRIR